MNISELLGAMVNSGITRSTGKRMKNALGGGNVMDSLADLMGGSSQKGGAGGIGEMLSGMLSGGRAGGGGIAEALTGMLGEAGRAVGGKKNLALGGLGALVGSLLGGGGKSVGGAVGGGLMALLGATAFNALKGSGQQNPRVPVGLLEDRTESQKKELEENSELILKAMINAAKADGEIDQSEVDRITGKLEEFGVDAESRRFLMTQLRLPMETERLIGAAQGQTELAAQVYGASLLAIEVDTPAERNYLDRLATGLGLSPKIAGRIEELVGLKRV
ncbi:MAG: tellurite resistance TerB family protein [Syntrophaceae bacterium]|nr:tellurite resistance TerB family protein [Syntrophaceae bacterium]